MLFPSVAFFLFFSGVLLLELPLRRRAPARKLLLLAASYGFYAAWDWRFLGLILLSTTVDYWVGGQLGGCDAARPPPRQVGLSLGLNLGLLGLFKYFDFFVGSAAALLAGLGVEASPPLLHLVLPVGISFYTFQTLSYTLDVAARRLPPCRSPLDFALFVAFFPQLVAGPIVRAREFLPQLAENARPTRAGISLGLYDVCSGLFKKVVIADLIGAGMVDPLHADPGRFGVVGALLGIYGYAFQLYGDFAGYSQIAIGLARMLGFRLPVNFRAPYLARTMSDFWRRWHISLSTWLRDYLYLPLGGSRGGLSRTRRNLLITMVLGGLWHGAGWNFLIWGAIHGVALVVSHARRGRRAEGGRQRPGFLPRMRDRLVVFHVWALSLVFFRAAELGDALEVFQALARPGGARPSSMLAYGAFALTIALHLGSERWKPRLTRAFVRMAPELQGAALLLLLGLLSLLMNEARPFVYFQF